MLDDIKERIKANINRRVRIVVCGMRNHKEIIEGEVISCLPNVFVVNSRGLNRSFSYADVLIGDVVVTYL